MKNFEKYKTADERKEVFGNFCSKYPDCNGCEFEKFNKGMTSNCAFEWLELEAEVENPMPCPYCGSETVRNLGHLKVDTIRHWVDCSNPDCLYRSGHRLNADEAVANHNRICRAVKAAKEARWSDETN